MKGVIHRTHGATLSHVRPDRHTQTHTDTVRLALKKQKTKNKKHLTEFWRSIIVHQEKKKKNY